MKSRRRQHVAAVASQALCVVEDSSHLEALDDADRSRALWSRRPDWKRCRTHLSCQVPDPPVWSWPSGCACNAMQGSWGGLSSLITGDWGPGMVCQLICGPLRFELAIARQACGLPRQDQTMRRHMENAPPAIDGYLSRPCRWAAQSVGWARLARQGKLGKGQTAAPRRLTAQSRQKPKCRCALRASSSAMVILRRWVLSLKRQTGDPVAIPSSPRGGAPRHAPQPLRELTLARPKRQCPPCRATAVNSVSSAQTVSMGPSLWKANPAVIGPWARGHEEGAEVRLI
jgi:hypothetical protein